MKKKSKPASANRCTSTISGGALKCALEGEHTEHSTVAKGKRSGQYATWSILEDGRVKVLTFSGGKKQSEWFETAPKSAPAVDEKLAEVGYCAVKFQGNAVMDKFVDVCTLNKNHAGPHENTSTGIREVTGHRPMTLDDEPEDPGAETAIAAIEAQDEVDDLDMRTLARQQREERERHEAKLAGEQRPSVTDACKKCGRELGEHDGKKCPKPERPRAATRQATAAALTRIGSHEVHPAAALFPMIEGEEREAFRADIKANGLRKKIVVIEVSGSLLVLDGRNRLSACLDLGIEPRFRTFGSDLGDGTDPIAFVISENIARRHLNETQRAFVGAELVPMYEAQAKDRMRAGRKDPTLNSGQGRAPTSAELAARAVNVGKASIEAALKVNREGTPEVIAAAKDRGQMKVSTAAQLSTLPKQKQREIVQKIGGGELRSGKVRAYVNQEKKRAVVRKINEQRVAPMPTGPFGVIYGDYPWHYDNSDQHEGSRGHLGYPTMKLDEIVAHALEVAKRAAANCVVALWATNLYITKTDPVLEAYGTNAERRTVFTWPKPKFGVGSLGRGQTEHLVVTIIGSPVHTLNEVSTLLPSWAPEHPREHSSKPAEVRALLAKHCGGPFLELFAREQHDGWACWGAEADKFRGAA